jgi:hypothetical protein
MTVEQCSATKNWCPSAGAGGGGSNAGGSGNGTAFYQEAGTGTCTNCTISGNGISETGSWQGSERGGAISGGGTAQLRLVHCTIAGNLVGAASASAGIVSARNVRCENCIISGNLRNANSTGTPNWQENNFSLNTPRTVIPFGPLGGVPGVSAELGPLSLTFGSLPVMVPGPASPALEAGAVLSSPPATDQRGQPRAVGFADLGTVEVQATEATPRAPQSITFATPVFKQDATAALTATATSGLPVSFEFVSGPAALNGSILTFTSPGFAAVRATQPGNAATAPALSVIRVIEATHIIPFTPASSYTVYPENPAIITLPPLTLASLPVTWSIVTPGAGATLSGNLLTATAAGNVTVRGQNAGDAQYAPVNSTWTLTFTQGALWWDTPPVAAGVPPWFTLVEGSPHGLRMTARIAAPHTGPVPVPATTGVTATPAYIPAGQTSVQSLLTVAANPTLANQTRNVSTGIPPVTTITLFLANRRNVPLDVFAPAHVAGQTSSTVTVLCSGVQAGTLFGPPPDLSVRSFSVSAVDYDNPAVPVAVTLDSVTPSTDAYPKMYLKVTFAPVNRRVKLTVTTDDGISGQAGPISVHSDTNLDHDDIDDVVEASLQRTANQFHEPPLTVETDNAGIHAVLGNRPRDLQGWTVVIELSSDLNTWIPASEAVTTVTPNPDGTTERVSVLLEPGPGTQYVRLKATLP